MSKMLPGILSAAVRAAFPINFVGGYFDGGDQLWHFIPNPGSRIIFYTPVATGGTNTGPFTLTNSFGTFNNCYTRNTFAGCRQITAAFVTNNIPAFGDWVLYPGGVSQVATTTDPYMGTTQYQGSTNPLFPAMHGTYDSAAMTDFTKFNTKQFSHDVSNLNYPLTMWGYANGRHEGNIIFSNLILLSSQGALPAKGVDALFLLGDHDHVLIQRCYFEGGVTTQGTAGSIIGAAVSSLTSSGTTATATVPTNIAAYVLAGCKTVNITGVTNLTQYNGIQSTGVTYIDATHISYTFAGAGNVAAIGTIQVSIAAADVPAAAGVSITNLMINQSSCAYSAGNTTSIVNGFYMVCYNLARHNRCMVHHNGWARQMDRTSPTTFGLTGPTTAVTTITQAGGVATVTCASTAGITSNVTFVCLQGTTETKYHYPTRVTVLNGTQYSFPCDPAAIASATGGTWQDAGFNGWDGTKGNPPTIFNHNYYLDSDCIDSKFDGIVCSWDASNTKVTGSHTFRNWVDVRCPMAHLTGSNGNDASNRTWPLGATYIDENHLTMEGANITTGLDRGWATQVWGMAAGSYQYNNLTINQPASSDNRGYQAATTGVSATTQCGLDVRNGICANVPGLVDVSVVAQITKKFNNVWVSADVAGTITTMNALPNSAGNSRIASLPAGIQAGITAALACNVYDTFRLLYPAFFSGVSGGTALTRELACLDIMAASPWVPWASMISTMVRPNIGR